MDLLLDLNLLDLDLDFDWALGVPEHLAASEPCDHHLAASILQAASLLPFAAPEQYQDLLAVVRAFVIKAAQQVMVLVFQRGGMAWFLIAFELAGT